MNKIYFFFFMFLFLHANAQVQVKGKLLLEDFTTTKVSVKNKNSNQIIESDWRGVFEMEMKENDTLVFFQNDIIFDELVVPKYVIESKALRFFLKKEGTRLEDLVIDKGPMFNFGGKSLTKVEKLELQNATKMVQNNSIGITTDGFFNRVFGRTKTIKKIISMENTERDFKEFKFIYTDAILINQFKIPSNQVNQFVYYIVDSEDFDLKLVKLDEKYEMFLQMKYETFKKEYEL